MQTVGSNSLPPGSAEASRIWVWLLLPWAPQREGQADRFSFCEAGLGVRDVNADGPSLPWMHPRAGKVLSERECCYFETPGCL